MSPLRPNLSNFEGQRFVTQFLPIAPQPANTEMLVAANRQA
jgi:hypothetical protein